MMNPTYFFGQMRELLNEYQPGEIAVKLAGYQGAAAHTFTAGCDGFHPVGEQCNLPAPASDL